jgi:hypothetical protein
VSWIFSAQAQPTRFSGSSLSWAAETLVGALRAAKRVSKSADAHPKAVVWLILLRETQCVPADLNGKTTSKFTSGIAARVLTSQRDHAKIFLLRKSTPHFSTSRRILMKRFVSTALVVVLLLGLGTLAVLARGGGDILTPAGNVAAAQSQTAAAPDAGISKYNAISLPLAGTQQFASYDAKGLAALIGKAAVDQVLHWNPDQQIWDAYNPNGGFDGNGSGTNFSLALNGVYFLLVNSGLTGTTLSFIGDVPAAGSVQYGLVGGSPCKWNTITLPLDQSGIADAKALGIAIGKSIVTQELHWNAGIQNWDPWSPSGGFDGNGSGTNFATQIGYPYLVCLTENKSWP